MNFAILDLGTNTFHLLIADENFQIIFEEKVPVKIGKNGIEKQIIQDDAILRGYECLMNFKKIIDSHHVECVKGIATSAFRMCKNGQAIINQWNQELGLNLEIIDGIREAELIYKGVQASLPIPDKSMIIDIGGGSVEFIIADKTQIFWKKSFEIGGQRLIERYHTQDPFPIENLSVIESFFEHSLLELFEQIEQLKPQILIGSSGAFDTLVDILIAKNKIDNPSNAIFFEIQKDFFISLHQEILTKNRTERLSIPGMIPLRVDMIVVASILINFLWKKCCFSLVLNSRYALKEGVLSEMLT